MKAETCGSSGSTGKIRETFLKGDFFSVIHLRLCPVTVLGYCRLGSVARETLGLLIGRAVNIIYTSSMRPHLEPNAALSEQMDTDGV